MPTPILMSLVAMLSVLGAYTFDNSMWDVWLMLGFGVLAYWIEELGYPIAPLVIGIILGPMAEENFRRAMIDHGGNITPFFTRPISLVFVLLIGLSLLYQWRAMFRKGKSHD